MTINEVTTVEGLADGEQLSPLQQAFLDYDTFQCGYCMPGQLCSAEGLPREGHARYQARFVPPALAKVAQYEQGNKLLAERNSQRSIVRATGVSRVSVAKRLKKRKSAVPAAATAVEKSAEKALGSARTG